MLMNDNLSARALVDVGIKRNGGVILCEMLAWPTARHMLWRRLSASRRHVPAATVACGIIAHFTAARVSDNACQLIGDAAHKR